MIHLIFKWILLLLAIWFGLLLLGTGLFSMDIHDWQFIDGQWRHWGIYISIVTYGLYIYIACHWRRCCDWLASKVANGDQRIELTNKLMEKKVLAISLVLFIELLTWISRLSG